MQRNAFFALFCVVSVGMNVFVAGVPVAQPKTRLSAMRLARSLKNNVAAPQACDLEAFSKTKERNVRDSLVELIWRLLGMTVGKLLEDVNTDLLQMSSNINNEQTRLEEVMSSVDDATKEELRDIIENALGEALDIIQDIVDKLDRVLPSLTPMSKGINFVDPNDIICILLGISLEQFLTDIKHILERSEELMVRTISSLTEIATRVSPTVAEKLRTTVTEMERVRDFIRPVLTDLRKVLP